MIDMDDIGNATLFGGLPLLIIFLAFYFLVSKPEIDACHEKAGVIVRIESEDVCVDAAALKPLKKTP